MEILIKIRLVDSQRSLGIAATGRDDFRDDPQRLAGARRRRRPVGLSPRKAFRQRALEPEEGETSYIVRLNATIPHSLYVYMCVYIYRFEYIYTRTSLYIYERELFLALPRLIYNTQNARLTNLATRFYIHTHMRVRALGRNGHIVNKRTRLMRFTAYPMLYSFLPEVALSIYIYLYPLHANAPS